MTELTIDEKRELHRHLRRHITPDSIWRSEIVREELVGLAHFQIDLMVLNDQDNLLVEDWEIRVAEAILSKITSILDGKTQELLRRRNE